MARIDWTPTHHAQELRVFELEGVGPVDLATFDPGDHPLPIRLTTRVHGTPPPDVSPALRLDDIGGRAVVRADGVPIAEIGGLLHWRSVTVVPLPTGAFDDGAVDLEITLLGAAQTWPDGAWLDAPTIGDRADLPTGLAVPPRLVVTSSAELSVVVVGIALAWIGRRRDDPLTGRFGAGAVAWGASSLVRHAWAVGWTPFFPGALLASSVGQAAASGLLTSFAFGLLSPHRRRLGRVAPAAVAMALALGEFVPAVGVASGAALAALLALVVADGVRGRRTDAWPVVVGFGLAAVSVASHALVLAGLGFPSFDGFMYPIAALGLPASGALAVAVRVVRNAEAAERFVPRQYLRAIGAGELVDVAPGVRVDRDLAILFTDIRGFTTLSERCPPDLVAERVDRVLSVQAEIVAEHGGFVDKFVGDAVMALFPDAERAARAAVACVAGVAALDVDIAIGAGLHRGPVQVGVVGGRGRLACTALGDAVNVAARLEALTRDLGAGALATTEVPAGAVPSRPVGRALVKGRVGPLALVELGVAAPEGWEAALALVSAGRFDEAARAFERWPVDPVAVSWAARCRSAPPGWDGVVRQTSK